MKILNLAHGSFYALGAYAAASLAGRWLSSGRAPFGSYAMLILAAILVGLVVGPLIERGLLRFMYGKDEIVLVLVTYAVFLILEDAIKLVWGVEAYFVSEPYGLLGSVLIAGLTYPVYSAALVVVSLLVGAAFALVLNRTRQGKLLPAVIQDPEIRPPTAVYLRRLHLLTFPPVTMLP